MRLLDVRELPMVLATLIKLKGVQLFALKIPKPALKIPLTCAIV
jgi:hypothetical protein